MDQYHTIAQSFSMHIIAHIRCQRSVDQYHVIAHIGSDTRRLPVAALLTHGTSTFHDVPDINHDVPNNTPAVSTQNFAPHVDQHLPTHPSLRQHIHHALPTSSCLLDPIGAVA
eukprot:3684124-Rhodomonas_salina.2